MTEILSDLYALMFESRDLRRAAVFEILSGGRVRKDVLKMFAEHLVKLLNILNENRKKILETAGDVRIVLDLSYEIEEMKKDVFFLKHDEQDFYAYLSDMHRGFDEQLKTGVSFLKGIDYQNVFTDRDGTVNNYCGRYRSSIQSVYNAVFLSRFAMSCVKNASVITSAPLKDVGLMDISVVPEGTFVLAGSKGREYYNKKREYGRFPVDDEKQKKLDEINDVLAKIIKDPVYEKFGLIGSGLQFKFGQTTIARQDVQSSIPEDVSDSFLKKITGIVEEIDPEKKFFRIEDTGTDIEIILTVEHSGEEGLSDFDKKDGMFFLNNELDLGLEEGPNLICGDTSSDLPMIKGSLEKGAETKSVFVKNNKNMEEDVRKVCDSTFFVDNPDILVTILNELSKKEVS
ncbi:MAG: trehalose 6-phosphate synthase [bacterium]